MGKFVATKSFASVTGGNILSALSFEGPKYACFFKRYSYMKELERDSSPHN